MRVFEVSYNRTIQVKPSESKTIGAKAELDTTENFNQGIFKLISMVDRELGITEETSTKEEPSKVETKEVSEVTPEKTAKKTRTAKVETKVEAPAVAEETKVEVKEEPKKIIPKGFTLFDKANSDHKNLFLSIAKEIYPTMVKDSPEHIATKAAVIEMHGKEFLNDTGDIVAEFSQEVKKFIESKK